MKFPFMSPEGLRSTSGDEMQSRDLERDRKRKKDVNSHTYSGMGGGVTVGIGNILTGGRWQGKA